MGETIQAMPEENSSGMGKFHDVPGDAEGWSWGAFFWTWLWAIPNRTWVGLFTLLPLVVTYGLANIGPIGGPNAGWVQPCLIAFSFAVMLALHYLLGMNGRKWAWQNRRWKDVAHFNRVQRNWSIAALIGMALLALNCAYLAYRTVHVDQGGAQSIAEAREVSWKIGTYMEEHHRVPATLEDAGVTASYGADIADLRLLPSGQLKVLTTFSEFDGKTFTLAPKFNEYGQVEWRCLSGDIARMDMPVDCRYDLIPELRFP